MVETHNYASPHFRWPFFETDNHPSLPCSVSYSNIGTLPFILFAWFVWFAVQKNLAANGTNPANAEENKCRHGMECGGLTPLSAPHKAVSSHRTPYHQQPPQNPHCNFFGAEGD